jgi:hypothetical protein
MNINKIVIVAMVCATHCNLHCMLRVGRVVHWNLIRVQQDDKTTILYPLDEHHRLPPMRPRKSPRRELFSEFRKRLLPAELPNVKSTVRTATLRLPKETENSADACTQTPKDSNSETGASNPRTPAASFSFHDLPEIKTVNGVLVEINTDDGNPAELIAVNSF